MNKGRYETFTISLLTFGTISIPVITESISVDHWIHIATARAIPRKTPTCNLHVGNVPRIHRGRKYTVPRRKIRG